MSTYTHRHLPDLEDSAAANNLGAGFSARFGRQALDCESTGFALQRLDPGARLPFAHRHDRAEEVYVVLAGSGQMLLDEEVVDVAERDAIRVSPGVARSLAAGPHGLEYLVFGPHHEKDGEILKVDWPAS